MTLKSFTKSSRLWVQRFAAAAVLSLLAGLVLVGGGRAVAQAAPAASAAKAVERSVSGIWQGTLAVGNQNLRIQMRLTELDGKLSGTMYSLDQAAQGFKVSAVTVNGPSVKIEVSIGAVFSGTLSADGKTLDGSWAQGPAAFPLKLEKANAETAWALPAPPKQMPANADPAFDVATIKPNDTGARQMGTLHVDGSSRLITQASSLSDLISFAYDVQLKQVAGNEGWMSEDRYDILAKPDTEGAPSMVQLKTMIKKLLADRFQLKFHEEQREMSAFVVTVAKGGIKFSENTSKAPLPGLGFGQGKGGLRFGMSNATMGDFAGLMQMLVLDRPVVDETGLTAHYDMNFTFTPDASMFGGRSPLPPGDSTAEVAPNMMEALQEQVGLKMEAKKTPVKVLVIDHVAKPTGN